MLEFHCRINYESETPFARRMHYEQYRTKWLNSSQPQEYLSRLATSMMDNRTVAEMLVHGRNVAGYVWVSFEDVPDYGITIAEIMDIAVDSHYQRQGVGLKIMRHVETKAKERGATLLRSDTGIENVASQRLHEKVGFKPYRIHYEKILQ